MRKKNPSTSLHENIEEEKSKVFEVPKLETTVPNDYVFPKMKIGVKSSLEGFQDRMKTDLINDLDVLDDFRKTIFGAYLDIQDYVHSSSVMWQLLVRESSTKREKEMWFVVNGLPIRYSLSEFALITGLKCSFLNPNWDDAKVEVDGESWASFVETHWPEAICEESCDVVNYHSVINRFTQLCKNLRKEKNENAKKNVIAMAKLMFVVMVLYAKEDRKAQIPEWMLAKAAYKEDFDAFPWGTWAFMHSLKVLEKNLCGKMKRLDEGGSKSFTYGGFVLAIPILVYECIPSFATKFARRRSQMIPPVPRICLWKTRFSKTKPTNVEVNEALLSVTELQSILVPDEVETRAEWMSTFHSLISTRHEAIDDYVKVLEECVTTVSLKREHNYDTKRSEKKIKTSSPKNVPLAPHLVKDTASSPSIGEGPPVPHVGCCLQPKSMATPSGHSHTHDSESEYRIKEYIDKKIDLLRDEFKSKNDVIIKLLEKLIARGDVVEVEKVTSNKISEMSSMKRENVEKENTLEDNMVADDLVLDEQDHLRDENVAGEQSSLYHVRGEEEVGKEVLGRGRRKKVESSLLHTPWTRNNPKKKPKRVISLSTPKEEKLRFVELLIQQRLEQKVGIECHMEERFEISGIGKRWWTQLITPGEWIETTHMGEYLYVLRRRAFYESHIMKMDTFVLNEYFSAWCERSHITYPVIGDRLEKYIKGELKIPFLKPWTKEIRSVYFPYSIDSGHWVAIRADFDTGCLTVFDSLKSHCTDSYLDILLSRLRRIFPVLAMTSGLDSHTMTTKPIWDVCRPCVPQQTTNDCGVFALKFIELDMQGVGFDSLKGLQREDMKRLRLQIAYHICKEIKNKP